MCIPLRRGNTFPNEGYFNKSIRCEKFLILFSKLFTYLIEVYPRDQRTLRYAIYFLPARKFVLRTGTIHLSNLILEQFTSEQTTFERRVPMFNFAVNTNTFTVKLINSLVFISSSNFKRDNPLHTGCLTTNWSDWYIENRKIC